MPHMQRPLEQAEPDCPVCVASARSKPLLVSREPGDLHRCGPPCLPHLVDLLPHDVFFGRCQSHSGLWRW